MSEIEQNTAPESVYPLPKEERDEIEALRKSINLVLALEPRAVRKDLSAYSFEPYGYVLQRIHGLFELLRDGRLDELWPAKIKELRAQVEEIGSTYHGMALLDLGAQAGQHNRAEVSE
jgi:hypothetical protein